MPIKKLQSYASVNSGKILVKYIRKSNIHQIIKHGKNLTLYKLHHKHNEMKSEASCMAAARAQTLQEKTKQHEWMAR
jgi:hypothetical protein